MIIVVLQIAVLVVFAWLLRGSTPKAAPQEIRERTDRTTKR
jgi:hypothetical protein